MVTTAIIKCQERTFKVKIIVVFSRVRRQKSPVSWVRLIDEHQREKILSGWIMWEIGQPEKRLGLGLSVARGALHPHLFPRGWR